MKVTVFDIDGTLADISHRLHYIQGDNKDHRSFFAACKDDSPIQEIIDIVLMYEELDKPYIIVSGRSDECRKDTVHWLWKQDILVFRELYMRKAGDRRPDYIVKASILKEIIKDGYEVELVFDDRQQVVDMWRSKGYRVCQVDKGDF